MKNRGDPELKVEIKDLKKDSETQQQLDSMRQMMLQMQETIKLQSEIALMEKKQLSPEKQRKLKRNYEEDTDLKTPLKEKDPYNDFLKNVSESK